MKSFKKSKRLTLGIEEEYFLCNPATAEAVSGVEGVMSLIPPEFAPRVSRELVQCVLEGNTPVCDGAEELFSEIKKLRRALAGYCGRKGLALCSVGVHPFSDSARQEIVENEHYRWVYEQSLYCAKRMIGCGLHVHVGVDSEEAQLYLVNRLRRWIPALLAMSANSPFIDGAPTGFASTRRILFGSMPRTNYPPVFRDYDELEKYINVMMEAGSITRPGDLWWNVRPQPPLGTVEVRIMDAQTRAEESAAFGALIQALCAHLLEEFDKGIAPPALESGFLDDNQWKAMRYGLDSRVIDPETGRVINMREEIGSMLKCAEYYADILKSIDVIEPLRRVLREGNGAGRMLAEYEENGKNLRKLTLNLIRRTTDVK